jgi:WD40 repeat protein
MQRRQVAKQIRETCPPSKQKKPHHLRGRQGLTQFTNGGQNDTVNSAHFVTGREFWKWRMTKLGWLLVMACFMFPLRDMSAQQPCFPPALPLRPQEENIFNRQQEVHLGDIMADQISRSIRTANDPEIVSYLNRVTERLIKQLPDSHFNFRFSLVDLPTANSFALPGGRIYMSRKMILLARSEDELAAVIAHEMGHIVTHQSAIRVTRELKEVLGIATVGNREDILRKYNLLIDNWRRRPNAFRIDRRQLEQQQLDADQIAVFLMATSGYSMPAMETIFERTSGADEKSGSWIANLFGRTSPDVRRLREMIHGIEDLPQECIHRKANVSNDDFRKWQRNIQNYSGWDHQKALHNVLSEVHLDPPLQAELWQLRFSPDGNYILAQSAASIYVLTVDPLAEVIEIDAPGARFAQFTPDSRFVVFDNGSMRIEKWEIVSRKRASAYEIAMPEKCRATQLSPDGSTLACFVKPTQLELIDVPSSQKIYETSHLYEEHVPAYIAMPFSYQTIATGRQHSERLHMAFSPDSRFFVAAAGDQSVAFEIGVRREVAMGKNIRKNLSGGFVFLSGGRILAVPEFKESHSLLLSFPTGKKLGEISLGSGHLTASQDGSYLMLSPIQDFAVGVWNVKTRKGVMAFKQSAFDVFGDHFVTVQRDGEVGYFKTSRDGKNHILANHINLPSGNLGGVQALSVSDDLHWLALSEEGRGAIWDLTQGKRLYMLRGFRGVFFGASREAYVDFPNLKDRDRTIARASLINESLTPTAKIADRASFLSGKYLLSLRSAKGGYSEVIASSGFVLFRETDAVHGWTMTVSNPITNTVLWRRHFSMEGPTLIGPLALETAIRRWRVNAKQLSEEETRYPEIRAELERSDPGKEDEFLEVVDLQSGKLIGSLLLDTGRGSFWVVRALVLGDWIAVVDSEGRTAVYSLHTGGKAGECFGEAMAMNKAHGLLAVRNGGGHLDLFQIETMNRIDSYVFPSTIVHVQFSTDGNRLLVLISNQTVYTLELSPANDSQPQ